MYSADDVRQLPPPSWQGVHSDRGANAAPPNPDVMIKFVLYHITSTKHPTQDGATETPSHTALPHMLRNLSLEAPASACLTRDIRRQLVQRHRAFFVLGEIHGGYLGLLAQVCPICGVSWVRALPGFMNKEKIHRSSPYQKPSRALAKPGEALTSCTPEQAL